MPESHEPLAPYLAKITPDKFAPVSPPLKWVGGKAQLLPQMRPYFPKHFAAYHEPFLGGGLITATAPFIITALGIKLSILGCIVIMSIAFVIAYFSGWTTFRDK